MRPFAVVAQECVCEDDAFSRAYGDCDFGRLTVVDEGVIDTLQAISITGELTWPARPVFAQLDRSPAKSCLWVAGQDDHSNGCGMVPAQPESL